jgi:hypothetical protein
LGLAHPSEVVVAHQQFAGVVIRRIADLVVAQTRWSRPRKTSNVPLGGSKPSTEGACVPLELQSATPIDFDKRE